LHAPDPEVPVEESVGTLADLQTEGKIQHVGVSNFSLDQLKRAIEVADVQTLQNQYSVVNRREQDEMIDFCREHSISYIPWNPVGGRGNAPKIGEMFQVLGEIAEAHATSPHVIALAWLLGRSPNVLPIPGTRHFEYLKQDCTASELQLTEDELERLNSIGRPD
jgi:aryl-alcohol dehydrogenase-like predicted oxidoreductase